LNPNVIKLICFVSWLLGYAGISEWHPMTNSASNAIFYIIIAVVIANWKISPERNADPK